jgi:arginyl-tRNA--protein-N-Asp/Glu arginylyltransferase
MGNTDFQASYEESYQVYKRYQMVIHGETEEENGIQQFKRFLVDSPLIVTNC